MTEKKRGAEDSDGGQLFSICLQSISYYESHITSLPWLIWSKK